MTPGVQKVKKKKAAATSSMSLRTTPSPQLLVVFVAETSVYVSIQVSAG
jgi:hypothetical protein